MLDGRWYSSYPAQRMLPLGAYSHMALWKWIMGMASVRLSDSKLYAGLWRRAAFPNSSAFGEDVIVQVWRPAKLLGVAKWQGGAMLVEGVC